MPAGTSTVSPLLTRLVRQLGVNNSFIFDKVPGVPFTSRDGSYVQLDEGTFTGDNNAPDSEMGRRQIGGKYRSFDFGTTETTFQMEEFYAYKKYDWGEKQNADGPMLDTAGRAAVHSRHNIARELGCHDLFFTTGNWTNAATAAGDRFNNVNSNPPNVVRAQWEATEVSAANGGGRRVMIIPPVAMNHLKAHPVYTDVNARGEITSFGTHEQIAKSFDVMPEDLWVPRAVRSTQTKTRAMTATEARIWSEAQVWMGYLPTTISEGELTAAAYLYMGSDMPEVRRGEVDNGDERYDWMREVSVGAYIAVETGGARLLTAVYA